MTLFTIPHIKRRFASAMLVLWVFVLGAAWANACLLQDRTTHLDAANVATTTTPAVSPWHVDTHSSHAQGQSPCETPRLQVCDDASQSIVKWRPNTELPDMATLPPFAMAWSESVAALDAPQPVHIEHPARRGLPLRTRYVRLAL